MYVACTTEICSKILKDELTATTRRSRPRHLERNPFACKLAYHVCKEFLLLLNKPLYYSWSRCQYGDGDRVVWPPRTPAVGLQFQVFTCSVQLIIAKFEKLYTKLKNKYLGKCTDCSHPAAWQYLPSGSPIEWRALGVLKYRYTGWTYDPVIFTGLETCWKSSNSAHSCQIMMSRRLI